MGSYRSRPLNGWKMWPRGAGGARGLGSPREAMAQLPGAQPQARCGEPQVCGPGLWAGVALALDSAAAAGEPKRLSRSVSRRFEAFRGVCVLFRRCRRGSKAFASIESQLWDMPEQQPELSLGPERPGEVSTGERRVHDFIARWLS